MSCPPAASRTVHVVPGTLAIPRPRRQDHEADRHAIEDIVLRGEDHERDETTR